MELTPRTPLEVRAPRRPRRALPKVVAGLVVVALGVVAWQGLTNATVYFYNADEAIVDRETLGDRRFRLQGTVVDGSVERTATGAGFRVAYNGVEVPVRHSGATPELFQVGIPVVLEGHWVDPAVGDHFASDRILVRHTEYYEADYGDGFFQGDGSYEGDGSYRGDGYYEVDHGNRVDEARARVDEARAGS